MTTVISRIEVRCDACGRRHVDVMIETACLHPIITRFRCQRCQKMQMREIALSQEVTIST